MNLITDFLNIAGSRGDQAAILSGEGEIISYSDLARRSAALAESWRRVGVKSGDRVMIAMPFGVDLYAAIAGLWRLGATIVFPEPAMGIAGIRHAVELARPRAFLSTGWYSLLRFAVPGLWQVPLHLNTHADATRADPVLELGISHPALISFTSGSTGKPKGIVRSIGFLAAQNACVADLLAPNRDIETDLVAFPVFVIANLGLGITSVLPNWKLVRHDHADASALARLLEERSVTRALIPPTICELIARSEICPQIDKIFTGGGPVFPDLLERLALQLPSTSLISVYGSTEAEPIAYQCAEDISADQWRRMKDGGGLLAGKPIPQARINLVDDEIIVTGDHVNRSYLNQRLDDDSKIIRDGETWHRTGDAGHLDADGFLWLRGRSAAKAGLKYPFEIEAVARYWPGVKRAALLPGTDPPALAIEGDEPSPDAWRAVANNLDVGRIIRLRKLPLDRRHGSKIDYVRLRKLVS